jgi:DNA-binding NarL/FixJ family response regulator
VLYGRDVERRAIGTLLDAARDTRSGVLVVRGEAGIGKSALLEDARDRAPDMQVLAVRGVESESELAFAGLHQLLRPALTLLDQLPPPQSMALQGALGLTERSGDDRFLISAACLTLLSELAERRPVLCLIDDAQWLDTPSADALVFVARRLGAEGVAMLFAAREDDERRFEARGLPDLTRRGIDADAAEELIVRHSGREVAALVRAQLVAQSAGNALALIELPSALTDAQLSGAEPLPETLPLTRDVERVYLERVRRLSPSAQQLLLLVAADDRGRLAPVLRAAETLGIEDDALTAGESAGLVSVTGTRVEVRHPLVRSAVYQGSSSGERRAAHLALAGALTDEQEADQRAWHLAAAAVGPDAIVADELERTADRARLRGGHAAAATALERAAGVSADTESTARRLVAAANEAWRAGQTERATALLQRAAPLHSDVLLRAEADHLVGLIGLRRGYLLDAGAVLIAGAANVAPVDPHKAFEMLVDAGSVAGRSGDSPRMVEIGRMVAALPPSDDPADALLRDLLVGVGSLIEGKNATAVPLILDAVARAADSSDTRVLSWAATGASTVGDLEGEAALLRRALSVARESNAVDTLVLVLETVVSSAVLSGRVDLEAQALEGLGLAREADLVNAGIAYLASLAWSAAVRGKDEECRAHAAEVAQSVHANGLANANTVAEWAVATLDLATGRPEETITRLTALAAAPVGVLQPFFVLMFTPDLVEAYVRCGRTEDAHAAFAVLDAFAQPEAPAWSLGAAARCRGLLADDPEAAADELAEAIRIQTLAGRAFDAARSELLLGEHLRRRRQRVEARQHLRAALETFERIGAEPWTERARAELRASGETARKRDPTTAAQLTPQELQVARFVAEGLSNKEVAAQLFLSPRTIDAHLRSVFAKLGITSRTQLARLDLEVDSAPGAAAVAGATA